MPRRLSVHNAQSPITPANAVNEVIGALSRKFTSSSQNIETSPAEVRPARRPSFKMDHILHPGKKDKKRDDSVDRNSRKDKKGSLIARPVLKSKDRHGSASSPGLRPQAAGNFEMIMESPPAILHGSMAYSSGALISGRLKFNVEDPSGEVVLDNFNMVLQVTTTTKKPVGKECRDCAIKVETLKEWKFLSEPKSFLKMRDNQFPWSCMLDGRYPATTQAQLGSISYALNVHATTALGEKVEFTHPLQVYRAIPPSPEKSSIRIFPPTNLTGRVTMAPVVHPIGKIPVQMTLSGIVEKKDQSQTRWRLKKMMWRIEEHCKVKSTPCSKHKAKVTDGKAIQHTDSRQLGNDELKTGWKTDFDTVGGEIAMDFEISMATKPSHKVTCDVDSQSGLEVKHNLIIELIVAEEFVPNKNTNLITPTGAARVLRMQFALHVTQRAGMGISWDDEMPPMYEDVPPSPPGYGSADKNDGAFGGAIVEDYEGPEVEYNDLIRVHTTNPNDPPLYRERNSTEINAGLPMRSRGLSSTSSEHSGPSNLRQRLAGFRLDELEAEPEYTPRRRTSENSDEEEIVDYGEGQAS